MLPLATGLPKQLVTYVTLLVSLVDLLCCANQTSASSSQEIVNVTLSISHLGVKFCRLNSNVSSVYIFLCFFLNFCM